VSQLPAPVVMGAAGVGGITYWLAIFPVDVIKSSMQSDTIIKAERKYTDMATTARVGGCGRGAGGCLGRGQGAAGLMSASLAQALASHGYCCAGAGCHGRAATSHH
jgi:hypothetical protein